MFGHLPLWLLIALFVTSAAVIWFAGIQLSKNIDVLDRRLHIGNAFGGLIVLAVATNLPEIVITVTAAASGSVEVAVSNILGGIGIQTVVIVMLDLFGKRTKDAPPLTYRAASLTLVIEGVAVVAVLLAVVAGTQLPKSLDLFRITPEAFLIVVLWAVGLMLVRRSRAGLPWHENDAARDTKALKGQGSSASDTSKPPASLARAVIVFSLAAIATLAAGFVLERSGEAASSQIGLSGVLFGATVLALATSLPEISTGLQAVKQGDVTLAFSDIFGGNAFLPVLFLVAGLVSGQAVLPSARFSDIYLTALAALLTLVYIVGLIFRPRRRVLGMGIDSLIVLVLYLVGVAGLVGIAG
ncbi:MAG TPA: sodium:calcium antiporter [Pseudolysinimonas sp.]|nr:sodium:calcium antiporter [Pseudolysinimonas sp.]